MIYYVYVSYIIMLIAAGYGIKIRGKVTRYHFINVALAPLTLPIIVVAAGIETYKEMKK